MEISGKIHEIGVVVDVTDTFKKRDLVIEYAENPQYPEFIKMEMHNDKTGLVDGMQVGSPVVVSFNLRGRPWTDKMGKTSYFNTLALWKISASGDPVEFAPPAENDPDNFDLPF